jgi:SET domain
MPLQVPQHNDDTYVPLFRRCDDDDDDDAPDGGEQQRGRHLVANQRIDQGRLIFVERPLVALQSLGNPIWACHACKAFVGGPQAALSILAHRHYPELTTTTTTTNADDDDDDPITSGSFSKVVPCRHACGQVYCSQECEQDFWDARHQYLCTGMIREEKHCEWSTPEQQQQQQQHPLIRFKQHAVTTNEIFLLVAEWIVAEYTLVQEQTKQQQQQKAAAASIYPSSWIQSQDIFFPSTDNSSSSSKNNNPYDDFLMEPWWDVDEGTTTQEDDDDDNDTEATKEILKNLCQEASQFWQQHWDRLLLSANNNNNKNTHGDTVQSSSCGKNHTSLFLHMANIIGACELNSIGIRRRNPLCREIFAKELRHHQKRELLICFEQAGMMVEQPQPQPKNGSTHATKHAEDEDEDEIMVSASTGDEEEYSDDAVAGFLAELDIFEEVTILKRQSNEGAVDGGGMLHNPSTTTKEDNDSDAEDDDDDDDDEHQHDDNQDDDHDDLDMIFTPLDGTAMYALCCKMNHSCDPNVVVLYKTGGWGPLHPLVAHAVALRDIEDGEELCISYIDSTGPLEKRQEELKHYGFTCRCSKCEKEKIDAERKHPSRPVDTDSMVDDADDPGEDILLGSDDSDDDGERNKSPNAETHEQESDLAPGEDALVQQLHRLDAVLNHSFMGTIPLQYMAQASTFVIQTAKEAGKGLQERHKEIGLDGLLRHSVSAMRERNYVLAKTVGPEMERALFSIWKKESKWPSLAYREAYWCAGVCAAVGFAHVGSFLPALRYLDKASILGLDRSLINVFFSYVEYHASQIAIGPCLPWLKLSYIQDYGSPKFEATLKERSLSRPIAFAVDEQAVADENIILSSISDGKPVVIRQYASTWPSVHKWRYVWFPWMRLTKRFL